MNCIANYTSLVQGVYSVLPQDMPGEKCSKTDLCSSEHLAVFAVSSSPHSLLILCLSFTCFPFSSSSLSFPTSAAPNSLPPPPLIYYFLFPLYLSKNLFYSLNQPSN